jgi:error-prone DNA polymerase
MSAADYAPLWVKSNFSFLEGASHPDELVEQAHALGLRALALSDRDGVYGVVRAHMRAQEIGVRLIVGAELTIAGALNQRAPHPDPLPEGEGGRVPHHGPLTRGEGGRAPHHGPLPGGEGKERNPPPFGRGQGEGDRDNASRSIRAIVLCETRDGYGHLCRLISRGRLRSKKGESLVHAEELCELSTGIVVLCPEPMLLAPLRDAFGDRLYALVARHLRAEEKPREAVLREEAARLGVATVAATEVLYHTAARQPLQDVLTCIRHGVTLADAGRRIRANAEHDLKSAHAMHTLFADDLRSLARTLEVAERCQFSLAQLRYRYPGERLPDGETESAWLRRLTLDGARARFPLGVPNAVMQQIERELALIEQLEYGGYFLTMWEIVRFCRDNRILCQGRGSAANSAVCFCLGITAVDPVKLDLLFERFLSLERAEPPDIDLDIEHERREEVIQWVYERYGRRHAAMVANVIRYRLRSAVRDVGKVLGLDATAIDRMAKASDGYGGEVSDVALSHAGLPSLLPGPCALFLDLVREIQDFPRHLSIHPGGFLLGHEPVDTLVPIEPATMEERTVVQWDKYAIEDLGLFKLDLLGLGALTQIHACFDLLRQHAGIEIDMATVPHDDPETYAMIARGDTVGTFQIESRAQMSMLPRLKPATFYDLVIEVAIVRPGPIQGDMVHPYLRRRAGEETAEYPHPALRRVLEKTLGVPIFQEQVMKIAVLVGGYTPGEADQLRRDMAAWKSSGRIERHEQKLVGRMIANGITTEFAERIFSQIRGFGEYGFPESHAASFALLAYVTAWMRCHHPAAFACSLLNAQPMGFYAPATIVEDARRHGVEIRPIDVTRSAWDCTLEKSESEEWLLHDRAGAGGSRAHVGRCLPNSLVPPLASLAQTQDPPANAPRANPQPRPCLLNHEAVTPDSESDDEVPHHAIRMGLRYVKGLGGREREALAWAPPPYRSLGDFMARTRLSKSAFLKLAQAGALDALLPPLGGGTREAGGRCARSSSAPRRRDAIWQLREAFTRLGDALALDAVESAQPRFRALSDTEEVLWDYRTSHHSARGHPVEGIRAALRHDGFPTASELNALAHGTFARYVGMTICRQRPGTAAGVTFYTLEDETGFVNLVVWRDVFDRHAIIARTALLLGVRGRIQSQHDVVHLVADELFAPTVDFAPEGTTTRSFH